MSVTAASASSAISTGLMIPFIFGCIVFAIRMTYFAFRKVPATIQEKEAVVYNRLHNRFREEGHENPHRAASDRMCQHRQIEEFRRFACQEYAANGTALPEILDDWWKTRRKAIQEVAAIGSTKADATIYSRILRAAIAAETEEGIFIYQPAKRKWQDEKAKRDAELEREMKRGFQYDPVSAHVIEQMYAAGDNA